MCLYLPLSNGIYLVIRKHHDVGKFCDRVFHLLLTVLGALGQQSIFSIACTARPNVDVLPGLRLTQLMYDGPCGTPVRFTWPYTIMWLCPVCYAETQLGIA